ncbi:hypothetical protein NA56DRAFT_704370 [Hyaloscypha hepaticicola]|uniref:Uncharacterized protein n=1 Tax=Hyaloscypha hepaticicola TaxID=2082293 RepID=A0A2J6Q2X8_9HELO|nr:hypothetical protein NA56DRAFT_704370 [Hyaloscypha hepaticicola]
MYGRGRWTWFLPVAKGSRGRGSDSDAERPLGIGELRQVLRSDLPGGGQENGETECGLPRGGRMLLVYVSSRPSRQSGEGQKMLSGWVHGTKWGVAAKHRPLKQPPWQIRVRARMPSTDKTDPRHAPCRNLKNIFNAMLNALRIEELSSAAAVDRQAFRVPYGSISFSPDSFNKTVFSQSNSRVKMSLTGWVLTHWKTEYYALCRAKGGSRLCDSWRCDPKLKPNVHTVPTFT